jgi:hypothetical protein
MYSLRGKRPIEIGFLGATSNQLAAQMPEIVAMTMR